MPARSSDIILDRMMTLHPEDHRPDPRPRLAVVGGAWTIRRTKLPPVIHIAGTNGKGSTQAMFRAGIEGAGQRAHAYTSPHLVRFHERIRLAGDLIAEDALDRCARRLLWDANKRREHHLFRDHDRAPHLLAFARTRTRTGRCWRSGWADGLTPRMWSMNGRPVTGDHASLDLDHQQFLGETLAEIAAEKAGIMKRGCGLCCRSGSMEAALEVIEGTAAKVWARRFWPMASTGMCGKNADGWSFQDETGLAATFRGRT